MIKDKYNLLCFCEQPKRVQGSRLTGHEGGLVTTQYLSCKRWI